MGNVGQTNGRKIEKQNLEDIEELPLKELKEELNPYI